MGMDKNYKLFLFKGEKKNASDFINYTAPLICTCHFPPQAIFSLFISDHTTP